MSELELPVTRTLASVLRGKLGGEGGLQLITCVGGSAIAAPTGNAYVNVVIRGVEVRVPKLSGIAAPAVGGPAYVLASRDFLLYVGSVSVAAAGGGGTGPQGPPGPAGTPGEVWFTGAGAPAGALAGSIVGDWYLDSANGDYYEKTGAAAWTLRGNLRGPTGATGSQGAQGNPGATGATGAQGVPGQAELGVTAVTSNVTITSITEATPDTVASVTVTADGTAVMLEYSSPRVTLPVAASVAMIFSLWEGGTNIARLGVVQNVGEATGQLNVPVFLRHRFTPSAAAHTYSVRAYVSLLGTGTALVQGGAGTGGAGVNVPALLRVIRV